MLFLISVRGRAPLSKARFWSAKWKWQQNLSQPILSVCITYLHGKPEHFSLGLLSLRLNNRPPGNSQLMCLFIRMLLFIKMLILFIISPYRCLRQWNLHCVPDSRFRNDPLLSANPHLGLTDSRLSWQSPQTLFPVQNQKSAKSDDSLSFGSLRTMIYKLDRSPPTLIPAYPWLQDLLMRARIRSACFESLRGCFLRTKHQVGSKL